MYKLEALPLQPTYSSERQIDSERWFGKNMEVAAVYFKDMSYYCFEGTKENNEKLCWD
jgi:hypothetical protein